jgi:preprotein translocase subunit Sss1
MNHYRLAKEIFEQTRPVAKRARRQALRELAGNLGLALWGLLVLGVNVGVVLVILHFVIKYW